MTDRTTIARSRPVTLLAWILIAAGALVTPVSVIALLMLVAGSDGAQGTTASGFFVVVVLPPATVLAGLGLWRRSRWAYPCVLLLLGGIATASATRMLRGPTEAHTEYSATGVPTHVLGSEVDYAWHTTVALVSLGVLGALLVPSVRAEFVVAATAPRTTHTKARTAPSAARGAEAVRGWRVGHRGRDELDYEELHDGRWERLRISGEMLTGRAHHVIYFASPRAWQEYPAWARDRRDEIVARVKSELRPPDYEYQEDGPAPLAHSAAAPAAVPPAQWRALAAAIVLLLGVAGGSAWLTQRGLASGATWLPMPQASQRRVVVRADEPATFWLALGIYATTASGATALAAWLAREGVRLRRSGGEAG